MKKKVIIVCYDIPEKTLPPVINLVLYLAENSSLKIVLIVRELSSNMKDVFLQHNIEIIINESETLMVLGKYISILYDMYKFQTKVFEYLTINYSKNDLVWVASHNTLFSLWKKINKYNYYLQLHELLDKYPMRINIIKYIITKKTKVIVPSQARAYLSKILYSLDELPNVLPNKPFTNTYNDNYHYEMDIVKKIKLLKLNNKLIILYQGVIDSSRPLNNIVSAISNYDNIEIILMGRVINNYLATLKELNKDLIHIDYILSPLHLEITKYADIGILTYSSDSFNNIYCAPNKIWEYSNFGIPMLCSTLPCLNDMIDKYSNGESCNLESINDIVIAINKITNNYKFYSKNSLAFFDSCNMNKILNQLVKGTHDNI